MALPDIDDPFEDYNPWANPNHALDQLWNDLFPAHGNLPAGIIPAYAEGLEQDTVELLFCEPWYQLHKDNLRQRIHTVCQHGLGGHINVFHDDYESFAEHLDDLIQNGAPVPQVNDEIIEVVW